MEIVDDDGGASDDGEWVERDTGIDVDDAVSKIPTSQSLAIKSNPSAPARPLPSGPIAHESERQDRDDNDVDVEVGGSRDAPPRHDWMMAAGDRRGGEDETGGEDMFAAMGTMGTSRHSRPEKPKADPNAIFVSRRELNTQLVEGWKLDEYDAQEKKKVVPGGAGSQWRMMRLRRVIEQAEEEGRPVEEVALERYGNMEDYNEALEERRALDDRGGTRSGQHTPIRRPLLESRPSSRTGFRKPGEGGGGSASTPDLRRTASTASLRQQTPIPSVLTPQRLVSASQQPPSAVEGAIVALSPAELNKLQAKVLRARLADDPAAAELEEQYERAKNGQPAPLPQSAAADGPRVEALPTLDGRGNLYDVGTSQGAAARPLPPGNRQPKLNGYFDSRDSTGAVVRYNADDDKQTLGDLVRQARFKGGAGDQKDLDAEMATAIATDHRYQNDEDYMDENAEKLGRKRLKTDSAKREFAVRDFAKTQKALDSCLFCGDHGPRVPVVALGTRAYLACTPNEPLVDGHCIIAPIEHRLSTLEMDDDDWEEVKNFMKCLMRMHAEKGKRVVFFETVLSLRQQRHSYVECVPVPAADFDELPGFFRSSILSAESEWSQNKRLIDFSQRPGGFRRMLTPKLPYFAVLWDYRGESGYGHVIEGQDQDDEAGVFPRYFASEIIGSLLDLEPRKWRHPKRVQQDPSKLGNQFHPYDWTLQLREAQ